MRGPRLPVPMRLLARYVGGGDVDAAVRVTAAVAASGRRVALRHEPGRGGGHAIDGSTALAEGLAAAGLATHCEIDLQVGVLDPDAASAVVAALTGTGVAVALTGPAPTVATLASRAGSVRIVVPADEPGAEERCRALADRRVRLVQGRSRRADLAFVRCLNLLMAGSGHVGVAATDARMLAITGERAAWYDRPFDSWEHVMPHGVRIDEQRRLVAAGRGVRVAVPWGPAAAQAAVRRLGGLS